MEIKFKENEIFREQYFKSIKNHVESLDENFCAKNLHAVKEIVGYPLNLERNLPKVLLKKEILKNDYYTLYKVQLESSLGILVFGLFAKN